MLVTSVLGQLSLRVAELVKSFEQHCEFAKVLTASATVETALLSNYEYLEADFL